MLWIKIKTRQSCLTVSDFGLISRIWWKCSRPLVSFENRPSVVESLPACLAWLKYNKYKLAKLPVTIFNPAAPTINDERESLVTPGNLVAATGLTQDGFSIKRWLFWRRRCKELYSSEHGEVRAMARACFEEAVNTEHLVGLEIPGEKQYLARLFQALDDEFGARGHVESFEPADIEIDMGWAEDERSSFARNQSFDHCKELECNFRLDRSSGKITKAASASSPSHTPQPPPI